MREQQKSVLLDDSGDKVKQFEGNLIGSSSMNLGQNNKTNCSSGSDGRGCLQSTLLLNHSALNVT